MVSGRFPKTERKTSPEKFIPRWGGGRRPVLSTPPPALHPEVLQE